MFRKQLIDVLLNNPITLYDISRLLESDKKSIENDLKHLIKSLKRSEYKVIVHPARCHKCSFIFSTEHLHKPGKCPVCKGTWIAEPAVEVVSK